MDLPSALPLAFRKKNESSLFESKLAAFYKKFETWIKGKFIYSFINTYIYMRRYQGIEHFLNLVEKPRFFR